MQLNCALGYERIHKEAAFINACLRKLAPQAGILTHGWEQSLLRECRGVHLNGKGYLAFAYFLGSLVRSELMISLGAMSLKPEEK